MPVDDPLDHLKVVLAHLHVVHDEFQRCVAEVDQLVARIATESDLNRPTVSSTYPLVLHETFSVHWRDSTCRLGPTTPFRLLKRLARRPNQYVTYDQLIDDVWDGQSRSHTAIRSAARDLRRSLRGSGMHALAAAIHGQGRCYGLMLTLLAEA